MNLYKRLISKELEALYNKSNNKEIKRKEQNETQGSEHTPECRQENSPRKLLPAVRNVQYNSTVLACS